MGYFRRLFLTALVAASSSFFGCSDDAPAEPTFLRAQDLQRVPGGEDPRNLIDDASFRSSEFDVEDFLRRLPPYADGANGSASFLLTYQSNGRSFVQAIEEIAARYSVNPFLLLARLQMAQGLVSQSTYPYPPDRVEYVFGCGCRAPGDCAPDYAGLDRQLECLAIDLATSFDVASGGGFTKSGWGIGHEHATLDGQTVKAANAATCAVYEQLPIVGNDSSGARLWMNIYRLYSGGGEPVVDAPASDDGTDTSNAR